MADLSWRTAFEWTPRQLEAWSLIFDPDITNVLFVGGARSGKTTIFTTSIVLRALLAPNSRHLIARLRLAHAKQSIWMDTLPKVIRRMGIKARWNKSDYCVTLPNGAEIWVDGLDDQDRVDKILGREYATIFLNEISQIPYDTATTVITRLAQIAHSPYLGRPIKNVAYNDLNPVGKGHWAYQQWILGVRPDGTQTPEGYAHLSINPMHNRENLPPGYIERFLETLPEHKRQRFLLGEWTDPEGVIFGNWEPCDEIPDEVKRHSRHKVGIDFGFSVDPAAVIDIYMNGDDLWLDELVYATGLTNLDLHDQMRDVVDPLDVPMLADSAEPKSIEELRRRGWNIVGAMKGPDSVRVGIDWLLGKRIHVTQRSHNLWAERENYTWRTSRAGIVEAKPIDDYNHGMDAVRYGCSDWIEDIGVSVGQFSASELGL